VSTTPTPTQITDYSTLPLETLIATVRAPAEAWFTFGQMMALGEIIRRARAADEAAKAPKPHETAL